MKISNRTYPMVYIPVLSGSVTAVFRFTDLARRVYIPVPSGSVTAIRRTSTCVIPCISPPPRGQLQHHAGSSVDHGGVYPRPLGVSYRWPRERDDNRGVYPRLSGVSYSLRKAILAVYIPVPSGSVTAEYLMRHFGCTSPHGRGQLQRCTRSTWDPVRCISPPPRGQLQREESALELSRVVYPRGGGVSYSKIKIGLLQSEVYIPVPSGSVTARFGSVAPPRQCISPSPRGQLQQDRRESDTVGGVYPRPLGVSYRRRQHTGAYNHSVFPRVRRPRLTMLWDVK